MKIVLEEHRDAQESDLIGHIRYEDGKRYVVTNAEQVWGDGEGHEGWTLYLEYDGEGGSPYKAETIDGKTSIERGESFVNDEEMVIPETINGCPVRSIGYQCFKDEKKLVSVKVPETVEDISTQAFEGCSNLLSIEFYKTEFQEKDSVIERVYDNLSYIDDIRKDLAINAPNVNPLFVRWDAFSGCTSLENIVFPDRDVVFLGDLRDTKWWRDQPDGIIYFNNSLLGIKGLAKCSDVSHVRVKEGTLAIAPCAFDHCKQLESVEMPKTVKHIGERAFNHCSLLKHIMIPEGVLGIGEDVFKMCESLESIDFPNSITFVKKIGWGLNNLRRISFDGKLPFDKFQTMFSFGSIPQSLNVVTMHKRYFKGIRENGFPENVDILFFEDNN